MNMTKSLVSLNVSLIKEINWKGKTVTTGIFKEPVTEKLEVRGVNITGDDQADRRAHGGRNKAIYSYASEHYAFWKDQYPGKEIPYGMFGENLTTNGILETEIFAGDRIRVGTTELIAVQPRVPCYKLGIRFSDQGVIKKFSNADYCGIYWKIHKEGEIQVGDKIEIIEKDKNKLSIKDIWDIMGGKGALKMFVTASQAEHIPQWMKDEIAKALNHQNHQN